MQYILLSNVEKSHSGCAYEKIVVKKLCLYDNIPTVSKKRRQKSDVLGNRFNFQKVISIWVCWAPGTYTHLAPWLGDIQICVYMGLEV